MATHRERLHELLDVPTENRLPLAETALTALAMPDDESVINSDRGALAAAEQHPETNGHALAEYRRLDVTDGGARSGWMLGFDRDITGNLRLGVGYNFTEFSDDLTDFDYDHRGWFINFVGSY